MPQESHMNGFLLLSSLTKGLYFFTLYQSNKQK